MRLKDHLHTFVNKGGHIGALDFRMGGEFFVVVISEEAGRKGIMANFHIVTLRCEMRYNSWTKHLTTVQVLELPSTD